MKKIGLKRDEIIHLGKLANLTLSEKELRKFQNQLAETLKYIQNLRELDTNKTPPTDHTGNIANVFFTDGERNTRDLEHKDALKNTKNKKESYFIVKRVL